MDKNKKNQNSAGHTVYKHLFIFFTALAAILVTYLAWRHSDQLRISAEKDQRAFAVMGTVAETTFYGNGELQEKAHKKVKDVFADIEKTCSAFNPLSELSLLNATAFEKPFKCSPLLWELIMLARDYNKISDGGFDITVKPLMELWGFHRKAETLPSEKDLEEILKLVGFNKLILDEKEHSVQFSVKGMRLDLGGIAKGWAVEKAADDVKKMGIVSGIINLGGNMYCFPVAPPGKKYYNIGIRDPFKTDHVCGTVPMLNQSVASSGNYERFVVFKGVRYAHIMDPSTGRPVKNTVAVTVISPRASNTDGLSAAIFVKGAALAEKVCRSIPGTSVMLIRESDKESGKFETLKFGPIWKNFIESVK